MFSIIQAAGWPIWPLLLASIIAVALIIERATALRRPKIVPVGLLQSAVADYRQSGISDAALARLEAIPAGPRACGRHAQCQEFARDQKEAIEEGGGVAHELERFLTTLGTIASIAPLMGLFGTVVGMIEIFGSPTSSGNNPQALAHGISVALYNTGFGLIIAIPSMIFYRHFRALVDGFLIEMEQEAIKLVEVMQGERR